MAFVTVLASAGPILAIIIVCLVLLPFIWLAGTYNGLVRLKQHCRESWSDTDAELRRRYDLIPNLVRTVKGYAAHEQQALQDVIAARAAAQASNGSPADQANDENMLAGSLRHLFAVSEGYPELKASTNFLQLQVELANTEDRIQAARRFYNANVRDLNTRITVFPSNIVAGMFGYKSEEFFQIESAAVRATPDVDI